MICRIRETSLGKPIRGKNNSDFSTRTFHKVVQHIRLFRLLQYVRVVYFRYRHCVQQHH